MPFIQEKQVAWGNIEFKMTGADNPFSASIAEFRSFSATSKDDSELVTGAGGVLWRTEGNNMPDSASMTWLRTRFIRFMTAVVAPGGRLADLVFSLAVIQMLRQTRETHREAWLFSFQQIDSGGENGSSAPLEVTLPLLLLDHTINDRYI